MQILCILKTVYLTIKHWISGGSAIIDGCSFDELKRRKYVLGNEIVICKDYCSVCGKESTLTIKRLDYELMKKSGAL